MMESEILRDKEAQIIQLLTENQGLRRELGDLTRQIQEFQVLHDLGQTLSQSQSNFLEIHNENSKLVHEIILLKEQLQVQSQLNSRLLERAVGQDSAKLLEQKNQNQILSIALIQANQNLALQAQDIRDLRATEKALQDVIAQQNKLHQQRVSSFNKSLQQIKQSYQTIFMEKDLQFQRAKQQVFKSEKALEKQRGISQDLKACMQRNQKQRARKQTRVQVNEVNKEEQASQRMKLKFLQKQLRTKNNALQQYINIVNSTTAKIKQFQINYNLKIKRLQEVERINAQLQLDHATLIKELQLAKVQIQTVNLQLRSAELSREDFDLRMQDILVQNLALKKILLSQMQPQQFKEQIKRIRSESGWREEFPEERFINVKQLLQQNRVLKKRIKQLL